MPLSTIETALFCRQLSTKLNDGMRLKTSLLAIADEHKNSKYRPVIQKILKEAEKGKSFTASIHELPMIFDSFAFSLILAGESHDQLAKSLSYLAKHLIKRENISKKIRSVMLFPVVLMLYTFSAVLFILPFIVPEISSVLSQIQEEIPVCTQIIVDVSIILGEHLGYIVYSLIVLISALIIYTKTKSGHCYLSKMKFAIPIFGSVFMSSYFMMFCKSTSALLSAGVPIIEIFDVHNSITNNDVVKKAISKTKNKLAAGTSVHLSAADVGFFPESLLQIMQTGEEYGLMPIMLNKVAEYYERRTYIDLKSISSAISPIIIITTGTVIMIVAASLYLPLLMTQV